MKRNVFKLGRAKPVLFATTGASHFFRQGKKYYKSRFLKSTLVLFVSKHSKVFRKLKLVRKGRATSQDESKLFADIKNAIKILLSSSN